MRRHNYYPTANQSNLVTENCTDNVVLRFRIDVKNQNPRIIRRTKEMIEHIPDGYQQILNDYGMEVVIFDSHIKDVPEYRAYLNRKHINPNNVENYDVRYLPLSRKALIKHGYNRKKIASINPDMHEVAHGIVRAVGQILRAPSRFGSNSKMNNSQVFTDLHGFYIKTNPQRYQKQTRNWDREEFWVESFIGNHHSNHSRKLLQSKFPLVYEYFKNLDEIINERFKCVESHQPLTYCNRSARLRWENNLRILKNRI